MSLCEGLGYLKLHKGKVKKEGEKLPQITLDNEMFFSFAFCTFFKIFHVRLGKKGKVLVF